MALQFPIIYLLPTHLGPDELHELEDQIPTLTYDADEAEVVLGKISQKRRALFELRRLKLETEEVLPASLPSSSPARGGRRAVSGGSRRSPEYVGSTTSSDGEDVEEVRASPRRARAAAKPVPTVKVVKLAWFTDSVAQGTVLPLDDYLIYEGRKVPAGPKETAAHDAAHKPAHKSAHKPAPAPAHGILKRARAEASEGETQSQSQSHSQSHRRAAQPPAKKPYDGSAHHHHPPHHAHEPKSPATRPATLLHQTTSEHDLVERMPPIPEYLHTTYSCQRPTPIHPPNEAFVDELKKIRVIRTLTGDKIGVRAYSSAIAALAAYPYKLSSSPEVARLPGCGAKIALLFQEFKDSGADGRVAEARQADTDPKLRVLKLFYDIWGVGETTARDFYARGWRDLDDVVEHGWSSLTRVQQIGVKYYDDFLLKIPRDEVERIGAVVLSAARKLRGPGCQMVIAGGYRRGKELSGDVDLVLSHPDLAATHRLVEPLVVALERAGYVTHTLTLGTRNSERGQSPVPWRGNEKGGAAGGKAAGGSGFDTLDKALVVWQDPVWTSPPPPDPPEKKSAKGKEKSTPKAKRKQKNPNPHRRVDIIVSPWRTAGCAVLGWTSGATFQRDLRRYCKRERGLKFDSSGVRSRADGSWVDLEGEDGSGRGPAPDMLTAERRVFDGLGLEWRPPEERNTG